MIRVAAKILVVTVCTLGAATAWSRAPSSPAEELLARSIEFHDPQGRWGRRSVHLTWSGTGSEGEERVSLEISILADGSTIEMSGRYRGSTLEYAADGSTYTATVDGAAELDDETRGRMRLDREGGMFWRDYFGFLVGLPMKLRDPGTRIDPDPVATQFTGREVESIRVTYDADVGGDTWYFYFDPESAELVGCRFYHDEAANDGEYIVLEGLIEADGLRLPQRRRWYLNADDRFLGEDTIARLVLGG